MSTRLSLAAAERLALILPEEDGDPVSDSALLSVLRTEDSTSRQSAALTLVKDKATEQNARCSCKITLLQLVLAQQWLCESLDICSEHLAFWKDMELRPIRLFMVTLHQEQPQVSVLEQGMLRLIYMLGKLSKCVHAMRTARDQGDVLTSMHRAKGAFAVLAQLGDSASSSADFFMIPDALRHFLKSLVKQGALSVPSFSRMYWPELGLLSVTLSFAAHLLVSGALTTWLDSTSISRRDTFRQTQIEQENIQQDGFFSRAGTAVLHAKTKASHWLNKKILQHVTVPTRNLINELINHKELVAEIELFNKDDAKELRMCEERLEELLKQHLDSRKGLAVTEDLSKSKGSSRIATLFKLANVPDLNRWLTRLERSSPDSGAADSVTADFEKLARDPFPFILRQGRAENILRPISINIYLIKVEILYVLKALDYLLKGTNFNFELLATVPAVLAAYLLLRTLYSALSNPSSQRSAVVIVQRIRFILRDIEQLVNRFDTQDNLHVGRYILLLHQLHDTLVSHLWPSLSGQERRSLAVAVQNLEDPFGSNLEPAFVHLFSLLNNL